MKITISIKKPHFVASTYHSLLGTRKSYTFSSNMELDIFLAGDVAFDENGEPAILSPFERVTVHSLIF